MREILFRGKAKDKWCVGSLLVDWSGTCQIWEKDNDNALHNFIVDEKTVGQYTGSRLGEVVDFEKLSLKFITNVKYNYK